MEMGNSLQDRIRELERRLAETEAERDRLRAEAGGRDKELRTLRMVVENAAESIALLDLEGNILFVNHAFARTISGEPEDYSGLNVREIAPPDVAMEILSRFADLARTGEGYVREASLAANGRDLWCLTSVVPVKGDQGRVVAALTLTKDVTCMKEVQEELKKAREELEQRVLERTRALNEAVDRLQAEARTRRMAISALRESEERYRQIYEHAPTGLYELDFRRGIFTRVNDIMCRYTGYPPEELTTLGPADILMGDSRTRYLERIREILAGNPVPEEVEYQIRCKDGSDLWVLLNTRPVVKDGKAVGSTGVVHDITAIRKAREAYAEAEEKWRSLTENSPDYILTVDLSGVIRFINRTLPENTREEIIGASVFDLAQGETAERLRLNLSRPWKRGQSDRYEFSWFSAGRMRQYEASAGPVFKGDRLDGLNISFREVTERREMEKALAESEERYRTFLQSFLGIFHQADLDFSPQFFHGAVKDITGHEEEDFTSGRVRWDRLIHPRDMKSIVRASQALLREMPGSSEEREYRIRHRDGHTVWVHEIINNACGENGRPRLVRGAIYDITERKTRELVLKRREAELRKKTGDLKDLNTALKILVQKRGEVKKELEDNMAANIKELVLPYLEKLSGSGLDRRQESFTRSAVSALEQMSTGFARELSSPLLGLTPMEIRVAHLVREGRPTKEIAQMLHLSKSTIDTHRDHIREKLSIKNRKTNLRAFLLNLFTQ